MIDFNQCIWKRFDNMNNKKLDSKKKSKELVEQAAERLAEILIMQIM